MNSLRRYLFLCPDRKTASGGIAVIYDLVALLNRNSFISAVVHNSPSAGYPDYPENIPPFFTARINRVHWKHAGLRQKGRLLKAKLKEKTKSPKLPKLGVEPTDIIVTPEFMLAEALEGFPDNQIVVFVQNPFGLLRSYTRAISRGLSPEVQVSDWISIADVCHRHLQMIGAENIHYVPASPKPQDFPYQKEKRPLITFMPRKRPNEAALLEAALRRRENLANYELLALDGISRAEVSKKLQESRIFISLLKDEALGFPAAEAMSSGCIVVGFDGLGCAEYFDETTGVPVTEGDIASLVFAVERVVSEYEQNPAPYDAMRKRASERINERYSTEAFESAALKTWEKISERLG